MVSPKPPVVSEKTQVGHIGAKAATAGVAKRLGIELLESEDVQDELQSELVVAAAKNSLNPNPRIDLPRLPRS
jgi:hypothetical protein